MDRYPWAVVTGASSGLGAAYARLLAQQGTNLILAARRLERLEALSAELPVQTHVVQADLSGPAGRDRLWQAVEQVGHPVSLLFNNAGFGLQGDFAQLDRQRQNEMVLINVLALTDLAHRFINLRRRAGGGGALINNASVVGLRPVRFNAVYSATKAYVVTLSHILGAEVRADRIRVQALCPGPVPTEFQDIAGVLWDKRSEGVAISAEQTVQESWQALAANRRLLIPGAKLRTIIRMFRLLPVDLGLWLSDRSEERRRR